MEDLRSLVENIIPVLNWVAPGYLTIWAFRMLRNTERNPAWNVVHLVSAVSLSALYYGLIALFCGILKITMPLPCVLLVSCIIALVVGYAAVKIVQSNWFGTVFNRLNHTTVNSSIFAENLVYPCNVEVYCNDGMSYSGDLIQTGIDAEDPWIVLHGACMMHDNNVFYHQDNTPTEYHRVLININTIECILVKYPDDDVKHKPCNFDQYTIEVLQQKLQEKENETTP